MKRFGWFSTGRHKVIALSAAAVVGFTLCWAAHNIVFMPFRAICFFPGTLFGSERYRELEGELTEEFVAEVMHMALRDARRIELRDNRLLQSFMEWFEPTPWRILSQEEEFNREWRQGGLAEYGARQVYARRYHEGRISEGLLREQGYMVDADRPRRETRPLRPHECGLMEELVLKGGKFVPKQK